MGTFDKYAFGKKVLEKHGWRAGRGLGKEESGISEALKPKLKFDTAGIGHNSGEEFTFHWWDHVFNKAAKNLIVKNEKDGVTVAQKGSSADLISTKKKPKGITKASLSYGSFVKRSVLTDKGEEGEGGDVSSSSDDDSDEPSGASKDEKLFQACGGRTAHKGARHGLTLSGKLRRIQDQEEQHSITDGSSRSSTPVASSDVQTVVTKATKSKKRSRRSIPDVDSSLLVGSEENFLDSNVNGEVYLNSKKKKRRHVVEETSDIYPQTAEPTIENEKHKSCKKHKKNKRKKRRTSEDMDVKSISTDSFDASLEDDDHLRTSRKLKDHSDTLSSGLSNPNPTNQNLEDGIKAVACKKRSKKKKKSQIDAAN